jgi:hypothetical protein
VTLRQDVQFRGFPDDAGEDDDGNEIWSGRNIAEALKAALEQLGYRVSEPISAEHAGWELDIWRGRKALWLRINVVDTDECYLMTGSSSSWLWPEKKLLHTFLADVHRILEDDSRFRAVGWLPKGGSAGAMTPWNSPFGP